MLGAATVALVLVGTTASAHFTGSSIRHFTKTTDGNKVIFSGHLRVGRHKQLCLPARIDIQNGNGNEVDHGQTDNDGDFSIKMDAKAGKYRAVYDGERKNGYLNDHGCHRAVSRYRHVGG